MPKRSKAKLKIFKFKKIKPKQKIRLALFGLLISIGLNLFLVGWSWQVYQRSVLSFATVPVVTHQSDFRGPEPVVVTFPSINHAVAITNASIVNGIWEINSKIATHLSSSTHPGEGGNIVIYGHNYQKIFKPLHQLKMNDQIELTGENDQKFVYQIAEIMVVSPDQIEAVLPTDHEVPTLYTCTDWFDRDRLVIKAYPIKD